MTRARCIAIGDPHIQVANIPEVNLFIDKLCELIDDKKPDFIVVLGDILHTHERLHTTPLNKAYEFIEKLRQKAKVFVLVGNHDMCLAADTPILMYNGHIISSQNVKKGHILMGDDYNPRIVTETFSGTDLLYKIEQEKGLSYSVTGKHTMVLIFKSRHNKNKVNDTYTIKWDEHPNQKEKEVSFNNDHDYDLFCNNLKKYFIIEITVEEYLVLLESKRKRLFGYYSHNDKPVLSKINISIDRVDNYYGWTVDGNGRFLLGDHTVTHNCNNQQFLTQNHWMNGMKEWNNIRVIDTVHKEKINDMDFVFTPYVPNGRFIEALDHVEGWKKSECIFAHQEFHGCAMNAITSVEGDKWPEKYPNVISGHIHGKQKLQKNVYYPGSAMQHAFGESTKNIIAVVDFDKTGEYKLEEIDLKLPRKKIVHTDIENIGDVDEEMKKGKDKVKLSITGNYEQFKAFKKTKKYKQIIKTGAKVVFKPKKLEKKECEEVEDSDFKKILLTLVDKEKDSYLVQIYEDIINGNKINEDDVFFLK